MVLSRQRGDGDLRCPLSPRAVVGRPQLQGTAEIGTGGRPPFSGLLRGPQPWLGVRAISGDCCSLQPPPPPKPFGRVGCGEESASPSFPFSLPIVASMMSHAGGSSVCCVRARACSVYRRRRCRRSGGQGKQQWTRGGGAAGHPASQGQESLEICETDSAWVFGTDGPGRQLTRPSPLSSRSRAGSGVGQCRW